MKIAKAPLIPLAEDMVDGEVALVDPFDAASGREYVCPECRGAVHLRREGHERSDPNGNVVRDPCFAHVADDYVTRTCHGGSGESQRHRSAKILVAQALRRWSAGKGMQPSFLHVCACGTRKRIDVAACDSLIVDERVLGVGIGRLEPDVFVRHGDETGAIEVFYRHPIDGKKVEAYNASLTWWVELSVASILTGTLEWETLRASWIGPCAQCETVREHRRKRREQLAASGGPVAWDDSLEAWEKRCAQTCGACGMKSVGDDFVCTLCGADKRTPRSPFVFGEAESLSGFGAPLAPKVKTMIVPVGAAPSAATTPRRAKRAASGRKPGRTPFGQGTL